ncbi:MAG: helix-turn-helix domain-containing protein [Egibacteraceae bacterium]
MAERGVLEDRLWTAAEVAGHMRVSNMTIYRLINAGQLPAIRVGRSYRIRGADVAAYLDASTAVSALDHTSDKAGSQR